MLVEDRSDGLCRISRRNLNGGEGELSEKESAEGESFKTHRNERSCPLRRK